MNFYISAPPGTQGRQIYINLIISIILFNSTTQYSYCLYVNFAAITRRQRLWD